MAELSRNQLRNPGADRRQRRNSLIPDRRDTDAPVRRAANEIRSGTRGDVGGAEALMQLARQVNGTAKAFADRDAILFANKQREDTAAGAMDFQNGKVDPVKFKESIAYSSAVSMGRTRRDWYKHIETTDDVVKAAMNSPEAMEAKTPAERQAIIDAALEQHMATFGLDPEDNSKARDFGTPDAQYWVADQMAQVRAKVQSTAYAQIEKDFSNEAVNNESEVIRGKIRNGEPVDFEEHMRALPGFANRGEAKAAFLTVFDGEIKSMEEEAIQLLETDPAAALEMHNKARSTRKALEASRLNPVKSPAVQQVDVSASNSAAPAEAPKEPYVPKGPAGSITTGLRAEGMSDAVIAGFLGNFEHESALGQNKNSGDGGTAHGLAQWRYERVDNFKRVIGKHPKSATLAEQVRFVAWEMKNPEKAGMTVAQRDSILAAKTPEEAAELIDKYYERSNGKSRRDRAKAARRFAAEGLAGGSETVAAADPSVTNPESAISLLDKMPNAANVKAPEGAYSLTPEEREKLAIGRRTADERFNKAFEMARREKQSEQADSFILRLSGVGPTVTATDVREAMRDGTISARDGQSMLGLIEREYEEAEAAVRRSTEEEEQATNEAREDRMETFTNSLIAPLTRGVINPATARTKILDAAAKESDPVVRAAMLNQVETVNKVAKLNAENPEVRKTAATIQSWSKTYFEDINQFVTPSRRPEVQKEIEKVMNTWISKMTDGDVSAAGVEAYREKAEKYLDDYVAKIMAREKARTQPVKQ